jgi:tetratricopeptide (TPR) repeat protein
MQKIEIIDKKKSELIYAAIKSNNYSEAIKLLDEYNAQVKFNVFIKSTDIEMMVNAKENGNDADFYYYRGLCCSKLFKKEDSIADFIKSISLNPNNTIAHSSLAEALFTPYSNDLNNEMDELSNCIAKYPNEPDYFHFRALSYWKVSKYQEAKNDILKAIELKPDSDEYNACLLFIYIILNEFENSDRTLLMIKDMDFSEFHHSYLPKKDEWDISMEKYLDCTTNEIISSMHKRITDDTVKDFIDDIRRDMIKDIYRR